MVLTRYEQMIGCGVPRRLASAIQHAPTREQSRIEFRDAADSDAAELLLYEFIGLDWWTGEGMTPKRFAAELAAVGERPLIVRINSPGGDVWDGMTIFNQLLGHGATVTTIVEGMAASAASLIMMAGDAIKAAEISQIMVHDAWTWTVGNEQELRELADVLAKIDGQLAAVYAAKSGRPADEFRELMNKDTYLTATEAFGLGIVDEVVNGLQKPSEPANSKRAVSAWRNRLVDVMRAQLALTARG